MSWFPFFIEQMEDDAFMSMTPAQKVHYLLIQSEFNMSGQHYKPDAWYAAALDLKPVTIRKNRCLFIENEWFEVEPGRQARGRNLATKYNSVKWSKIQQKGQ